MQVLAPDFDAWLEQEKKGRRLFLKALCQAGIDLVHLYKNEDKYGVDVVVLVEDIQESRPRCLGTIEIENSTWNSWDYDGFGRRDAYQLPPLNWVDRKQITVPYRRLPRFLRPDQSIIVLGQRLIIPSDLTKRFYQKWDKSLTAFYMVAYDAVVPVILSHHGFLPLPHNGSSDEFSVRDYRVLFDTKDCSDYWKENLGNWFINLWECRAHLKWGAFNIPKHPISHYPVIQAVSYFWDRCGIRYDLGGKAGVELFLTQQLSLEEHEDNQ